jgi:uncharacterized protein YecT (DUF1311 family)
VLKYKCLSIGNKMCKNKFMFSIAPLLLLGSSICLDASAYDKHPIEKSTEACLDKTSSSMGMLRCNTNAYKQWDQELNRVYKALMRELKHNKKAKRALRKAQRAWLKYKKAELKNIYSIYASLDGSMWAPIAADARTAITKERALTLKSYVDSLQIGN